MLNEEAVRLVLKCVDRNKLQKNVDTGNLERDGEVFVNAARWVDFYGESWIKNEGRYVKYLNNFFYYFCACS